MMRRSNLLIVLAFTLVLTLVVLNYRCPKGTHSSDESHQNDISPKETETREIPKIETENKQTGSVTSDSKTGTNLSAKTEAEAETPTPDATKESAVKKISMSVDIDKTGGQKNRLPKAIVFGFSKCGTRAFLDFMALHPRIVSAGAEMDFFNVHYDEGLEWYLSKMPQAYESQIVMEKSPDYVHDAEAPKRMFQMNSTLKLIVLVCEPVRRSVSEYAQQMSRWEPKDVIPFEEMVMDPKTKEIKTKYYAVSRGRYAEYLKPWLDQFPSTQIHVADGDMLRQNPLPVLKAAEEYLGIEHYLDDSFLVFDKTKGFYCHLDADGNTKCLGESKGRPHPVVQQSVTDALHAYYEPYNKELFATIKKTFDW